jgi:peptidoglycan/xylan/chitin deacetylase (PgdA/CDA1 family)
MLLCFDFEGHWGMPFRASYDVEAGAHSILDCLRRYDARAVFFTVGSLALEMPELIRDIAREGHEIALHGWRHERLAGMSPAELSVVDEGLRASEAVIKSLTGRPPTGFRAPFLLAPRFFDANLYELLERHGYRWVSNREIRYPVELARPDRLRTRRASDILRARPALLDGAVSQMLSLALNSPMCLSDPLAGSPLATIRWLRSGSPPFHRGSLLEIPVYSPLDCDLIGLPAPDGPTPPALLQYARFALSRTITSGGPLAMVTFHDWIVAGGNRLWLLDTLLQSLAERSVSATTVEESWSEMLDLAAPRLAAAA